MSTFIQDPDALLDYAVDWSDYLATGDFIVSAETSAQSGITIASQSFTSAIHTIFLEGGTEGEEYEITSRIFTNGGRRDDRTFLIIIEEK